DTENFTFTVSDGDDADVTQPYAVLISGADDQPTLQDVTDGSISEVRLSGTLSSSGLSGTLVGDDVDVETLTYGVQGGSADNSLAGYDTSVDGTYGTLYVNSGTGAYQYVLTTDIEGWDDGESDTENFTFTVSDGDDADVTQPYAVLISGANDAPVAKADTNFVDEGIDGADAVVITGNVIIGEDHGSDAANSNNGSEAYADVADTDVDSSSLHVVRVNGVGSTSGDGVNPIADGTQIIGSHGILTINADGSYSYDLNDDSSFLDALNIGDETNDIFIYTVSDGVLTSTTSLIITINGQDDPTQLELAKDVWLPADPGQLPAEYTDGYPLNISVYDVDTDLSITFTDLVTATVNQAAEGEPDNFVSIGKVVYWDGDSWEDVALNQEFNLAAGETLPEFRFVANPDLDINFITTEIADLITYTVTGEGVDETANVTLHALPPNDLPQQSAQVGDGSSPLTSGNDQESVLVLEQALVNSINADPYNGSVTLYTDFQQSPFTVPIDVGSQDGVQLEQEVTATIIINGIEFIVHQGTGDGGADTGFWQYDSNTGLMTGSVSYDLILRADDDTVSLAEYLTDNPPSAGDNWTVVYNDDDGGNYQARFVQFDFSLDDPGDLGVTAVGTDDPNLMFGSNNGDDLTGGAADDILIGRDGDDILAGLGGSDSIVGGAGIDSINGGAGSDILTGGTEADIFIWNLGDTGTDTVTDFNRSDGGVYNPAEGDVLDLSALLVGEDSTDLVDLANFIDVTESGGNTTIKIDVDGSNDFVSPDQEIVLTGVTGVTLESLVVTDGSIVTN
ncbi:VCBS domain-containing protein, partial [Porticoccus litoralis]